MRNEYSKVLAKKVIEDFSQFLRRRKVEKLLSQVQLVIGSVQPIVIKRKIRSSSQLISADARVSGRSFGKHGKEETVSGHDARVSGRPFGEHGKEETVSGHDGKYRWLAVGSHRRQNVCN